MASNREMQRLFTLYAELLHLHQGDETLADRLQGAAYRIGKMDETVSKMEPKELSGFFHSTIVAVINQFASKGAIEELEELIQLTPPGLFEMMRIKGLGGKKLSVLWKKAKIDTIEDLLKACKAHKLSTIPGFGTKTEQNIIAAIENLNATSTSFHFADVADAANFVVNNLHKIFKNELLSLCGDIRRQTTTVSRIEIITTQPAKGLKITDVRTILNIQKSNTNITEAHTIDEFPVTIYHTTKTSFFSELFKRTGNQEHVNKVLKKIPNLKRVISEESLYHQAGLPFIVPEMRENVAEWKFKATPDQLVAISDIKGVVHNHTTWSDGVDSLEAFVSACKKKGFEYALISDHSQNAHYAGGLKPDKVLKQFEAIDKLNNKLATFKIFKSIECDILISGELDYDGKNAEIDHLISLESDHPFSHQIDHPFLLQIDHPLAGL